MRSIKTQFVLTYAVMGSVLPFLPVFLDERGLSRAEIGYVMAVASFGVVFTPVVVTLLADAAVAARYMLTGVLALSGASLAALLAAHGFWPALVLYALHAFAFAPAIPLQDGITFAAQSRRADAGRRVTPYHAVRVWGTIGFIVPSVVLYFFLGRSGTVSPCLWVGTAFAVLAALNALLLPGRASPRGASSSPSSDHGDAPEVPAPPTGRSRLPTAAAARAMLEPHVLVFCVGMLLLHMSAAAYYQFYPLHLTDRAGIDRKWVGLIANVGVTFEILFMLAFGWMVAKLSLRGVVALAALCVGVRLLLLAAFDSPVVAVGTQLFHGATILGLHVAPPVFLNRHADESYRNSMQGLFSMTVFGTGRILGSLLAGHLAQRDLAWAFGFAGVAALLACGLFQFAFQDRPRSLMDSSAGAPDPAAAG